jgi:hypothetical protein
VSDKRVLRRIFGPKREEVTGEWSKLHYEELHKFYSSPDIIRQVRSGQVKSRRMLWTGHMERMGEDTRVYKVLVGKPEGKRPLGGSRHRWEYGIRMEHAEMDLIRLAQDRDGRRAVVRAVMSLRVLAPRS